VGHIVSPEGSLELIPANSIGIEVGIVVSLPPICSGSQHLVHYEQDLLMVRALCYLQLLLD
jgi:hypothetical protein